MMAEGQVRVRLIKIRERDKHGKSFHFLSR